MNDIQIEQWLKSLRKYHGADRVTLRFEFDDGQVIEHEILDQGP